MDVKLVFQARETQQRVDDLIVGDDAQMTQALDEVVNELSSIFDDVSVQLGALQAWASAEMMDNMKPRTHAHRIIGLDKLRYAAANDFVRGWNVLKVWLDGGMDGWMDGRTDGWIQGRRGERGMDG